MTRPVGPTIPRWQLGHQLSKLRIAAEIDQKQVAERLGCSVSKIQKIEAGDVRTVRAELEATLDMYGMEDSTLLADLEELRSLGDQRGWWVKYGAFGASFSNFLGLETAASSIRIYEPLVVYGLIQTPDYAKAIAETWDPRTSDEEVERQVRIRLARQQTILGEDPPEVWVLLDEAVLHRPVGGPDVMAAQLEHLMTLPRNITLQIVPFSAGGHPGLAGAVTTFEFDEDLHSPVAYVASQGGNLYLEKEHEVQKCQSAYNHIAASALNKQASAKLIAETARSFINPARS